MDAAAAATLLSPTSSTDAVSSASLMMIAQQFFQHQYQHQQQQQQDCDELLLPSFSQQQQQTSMNLTSCWNTINHHPGQEHEEQQPASHLTHCASIVEEDVTAYLDGFSPPGTPPHPGEQQKEEKPQGEDWMDYLMMGSCISDEAGGATTEYPSESSHSSELLTPDDIWREHFGLNLASSSRCSNNELWSGSNLAPNVSTSATTGTIDPCSQQQQESLEQLIQLLVSCLDDIDEGNAASATSTLAAVQATASASGSAVQKCASYFASALEARMDPALQERRPDGSPDSIATAYKTLTDACPYLKFAHLTANQALLEAIEGARNIHIVDYGTMQGVQWAAFLQAFATWPTSANSSRKLRITGIPSPLLGSNPASAMRATQRRLTDFAKLLGVDFEFHPVVQPIHEFQPSQCQQLATRGDEVVAVNFVLQLAQLPAVALHRAFSLVQRLNPRIVTVAEYEANSGSGARAQLASNARFYHAVLESMDVTLPREHPQRIHAERLFFGEEIRRSLCRRAASRDETSEWQRCVDSVGLWSAPLSHYTVSQARLLLWLYNKSDNFTLVQGPGSLSLGWMGTSIVTVSAWHC